MKYIIMTLLVVTAIKMFLNRRITVFEYEKAVKYTKGKFTKILAPGQYFILSPNIKIQKLDVRPRFVMISGQEVLSEDGVSIKISLAAEYEMSDPYRAVNKVEDYNIALYTTLQLALRDIISGIKIEEVMGSRKEIKSILMETTCERALEFGLNLKYVGVKDMMFPGELKKIFSQVIQAKKEGLAALEKARGETAALRNLANASKMLENNPALMKLKLLQSTGNTLVVGFPEDLLKLKSKEAKV